MNGRGRGQDTVKRRSRSTRPTGFLARVGGTPRSGLEARATVPERHSREIGLRRGRRKQARSEKAEEEPEKGSDAGADMVTNPRLPMRFWPTKR